MFRWFLRNVSALILSLTLAIIIWIVAVNEQDPFEEKVFPEPVPITVAHLPPGMTIVGEALAPVDVRVRAPASVWASLKLDQLHVTADLSNGGGAVQLTGTVDQHDARVTAVTPAQLQLTLEQIVRRAVPVRLEIAGDPSIGYRAGTPSVSASTAEISGPASIADSVSELVVRINIADTKESFNGAVPLQPVNTSGQAVGGISIEPSEVTVKIPVEQLGGYRDVAVKAVIEGQAATGYRITNIVVSPP
ncbi:MAG: CdaR family protein, partial [Chloroflexota bacterium]